MGRCLVFGLNWALGDRIRSAEGEVARGVGALNLGRRHARHWVHAHLAGLDIHDALPRVDEAIGALPESVVLEPDRPTLAPLVGGDRRVEVGAVATLEEVVRLVHHAKARTAPEARCRHHGGDERHDWPTSLMEHPNHEP